MSRNNQPLHSNLDDRLAEFTDDVLNGREDRRASDPDAELLLLEETVLRLKNTYPPPNLDAARVKQMQVRFKNRLKREEQETNKPFLEKWLPRPQVWALLGALGVIAGLMILSPYLASAGPSIAATALTPARGTILGVVLIVLVALIFWNQRRK